MTRIVDLSHRIENGMTTYPGLPGPRIEPFLTREASRERYAPGTEFFIGRIDMVVNTGTYIDVPFHRYADGADLASFPLERTVDLDGVVVDATGRTVIGADVFEGSEVSGRAVLIRTDWSRHWGTDEYFHGHPHVGADAVRWLVERQPALVGIDTLNIDDIQGGERPAHSELLAAAIPIVEHMCRLGELPETGFRFSAAPAAVAGLGSFPVRAVALLDGPAVER
jgi:kynurenine formamidase